MKKEFFVSCAEIMKPWFVVVGLRKTMFGAASTAGCQRLAFSAPAWQRSFFSHAEPRFAGPLNHLRQQIGNDIAETVFGIDTVVAGIDIAVVLKNNRTAARARMDADRRRVANPSIEHPLEIHHENLAHIMTNPFFVESDQKVTVFFRYDRPGSNSRLLLFFVQ